MSDPQPTTTAGSRLPAGLWPWSLATKTAVAAGTVITVLLIAGLSYDPPDPVDGLPAPPTTADPVRAVPLIHTHRPDCGLPRATLDALVPRPEIRSYRGGNCVWNTNVVNGDAADYQKGRRLDVSVTLITGRPQPTDYDLKPPTTPISAAMNAFSGSEATGRQRAKELKAVRGLGDEARAYYNPANATFGGGTVFARTRNAVVNVTYGTDTLARRQLPEKTALDGALRAATDIVRGLGTAVSGSPEVTELKTTAPGRRPRTPCEIVPAGTRKKLLENAEQKDSSPEYEPVPKGDSCRWEKAGEEENYTYYLEVTLETHPSVESARRDYLQKHVEARAQQPISRYDERYFTALAGLGERAFASYVEEGPPGGVVFQVRGIVATVVFAQEPASGAPPHGSEPLTRKQSVNGAYAAAKDVAGALRS